MTNALVQFSYSFANDGITAFLFASYYQRLVQIERKISKTPSWTVSFVFLGSAHGYSCNIRV